MFPASQQSSLAVRSAIKRGVVGNSAWGKSLHSRRGGLRAQPHSFALPARRLKAQLRKSLIAAGIRRDIVEDLVKATNWTQLRDDPDCLTKTVEMAKEIHRNL